VRSMRYRDCMHAEQTIYRQSDFLSGLPTTPVGAGGDVPHLSPADRLRLVHAYVTSIPAEGGLGITPGSSEWDLVESIIALHDREFNETWIRCWTLRQLASVQLDKIREQVSLEVNVPPQACSDIHLPVW
jgi:anoctamin-10